MARFRGGHSRAGLGMRSLSERRRNKILPMENKKKSSRRTTRGLHVGTQLTSVGGKALKEPLRSQRRKELDLPVQLRGR